MQLLKSHLRKLAQGKELFQIHTEADSPGPSFPGTRYSVGVVQTCCLSFQPEIPFYLASLACFLSKKSLDGPENKADYWFSNSGLHPTLLEYLWFFFFFNGCQAQNLYFERSLGNASDPATAL